jgi:hypothetical protein
VLFDGVSLGIGADENPLEPELGADGGTVLREVLGLSDGDVGALSECGALWVGLDGTRRGLIYTKKGEK